MLLRTQVSILTEFLRRFINARNCLNVSDWLKDRARCRCVTSLSLSVDDVTLVEQALKSDRLRLLSCDFKLQTRLNYVIKMKVKRLKRRCGSTTHFCCWKCERNLLTGIREVPTEVGITKVKLLTKISSQKLYSSFTCKYTSCTIMICICLLCSIKSYRMYMYVYCTHVRSYYVE